MTEANHFELGPVILTTCIENLDRGRELSPLARRPGAFHDGSADRFHFLDDLGRDAEHELGGLCFVDQGNGIGVRVFGK